MSGSFPGELPGVTAKMPAWVKNLWGDKNLWGELPLTFDFPVKEHEKFLRLLTETEDWLYEEGEDQAKQAYIDKLEELMVSSSSPERGNLRFTL